MMAISTRMKSPVTCSAAPPRQRGGRVAGRGGAGGRAFAAWKISGHVGSASSMAPTKPARTMRSQSASHEPSRFMLVCTRTIAKSGEKTSSAEPTSTSKPDMVGLMLMAAQFWAALGVFEAAGDGERAGERAGDRPEEREGRGAGDLERGFEGVLAREGDLPRGVRGGMLADLQAGTHAHALSAQKPRPLVLRPHAGSTAEWQRHTCPNSLPWPQCI